MNENHRPEPAVDDSVPGRAVYQVDQLDCPVEENLIRNKLTPLPGIDGLDFNLIKGRLTVTHRLETLEPVEAALKALNMTARLVTGETPATADQTPAPAGRSPWPRLLAAGLLALGAEIAHLVGAAGAGGLTAAVETGPGLDIWDGLSLALAVAAIALGGLATYRHGWTALRNFDLNMNALMCVAVTGALLIGQWPEAAMVMVLFNVAETIEDLSLARARKAIGELLKLTPETAVVRQEDGTWLETPADRVPAGALVRVRPGQRVALDGRIVSGGSALNQAPITGESLPVEKTVGDQVFAGSINESGVFEYQVTAAFENSTLARIIQAVEEAQASRAPIQRFVDRFARIYTPIVFAAALLTAVLPPLLGGGDWLPWIYKALVILVIACPCALVISVPVTIVSGLAAATRHGLLIKGGAFLEAGRKLKWIALDKTGTLTRGRPAVTEFRPWGQADPDRARRLAAALAARSDHPVSRAIAEATGDPASSPDVIGFTDRPGRGTSGVIDGQTWFLGNRQWMREEGRASEALDAAVEELEREGRSVVILAGEDGALALFAVADELKDGTGAAVAELKSLGLKTVMLTGDNEAVARSAAARAGLERYRSGLLPEDKLTALIELQKEGPVGMVGDGINDAPALARADIGFAMGVAGTDTAMETADVALMNDDPGRLAVFIRLSRATHRILWQNIGTALGIKTGFFILALAGQATMWMAVFADIGVSLLVVANGLRMLRQ